MGVSENENEKVRPEQRGSRMEETGAQRGRYYGLPGRWAVWKVKIYTWEAYTSKGNALKKGSRGWWGKQHFCWVVYVIV